MTIPTHEEKQRGIWDALQSDYPYQCRRPRRRPNKNKYFFNQEALSCEVHHVFTNWGFRTREEFNDFNQSYPTNPLEQLHFFLLAGQSVWFICCNQAIAKAMLRNFYEKYPRKDRVISETHMAVMQEDPLRRQTQRAPHIKFVSQSSHSETVRGTNAIVHVSADVTPYTNNPNRDDWLKAKTIQEKHRLPL